MRRIRHSKNVDGVRELIDATPSDEAFPKEIVRARLPPLPANASPRLTVAYRALQKAYRAMPAASAAVSIRHPLVESVDVTSSVNTLKPASMHGPNEVTIATSVASRPRAIKIRPTRGLL
jgi:hypothetical protein